MKKFIIVLSLVLSLKAAHSIPCFNWVTRALSFTKRPHVTYNFSEFYPKSFDHYFEIRDSFFKGTPTTDIRSLKLNPTWERIKSQLSTLKEKLQDYHNENGSSLNRAETTKILRSIWLLTEFITKIEIKDDESFRVNGISLQQLQWATLVLKDLMEKYDPKALEEGKFPLSASISIDPVTLRLRDYSQHFWLPVSERPRLSMHNIAMIDQSFLVFIPENDTIYILSGTPDGIKSSFMLEWTLNFLKYPRKKISKNKRKTINEAFARLLQHQRNSDLSHEQSVAQHLAWRFLYQLGSFDFLLFNQGIKFITSFAPEIPDNVIIQNLNRMFSKEDSALKYMRHHFPNLSETDISSLLITQFDVVITTLIPGLGRARSYKEFQALNQLLNL